jgi:mRNA-degrading endonuclease toxin of MazEF toxin-antitoxin module
MEFILAVDEEMQGIHLAVVISNDSYNSNRWLYLLLSAAQILMDM